jgi:hypothetical protein
MKNKDESLRSSQSAQTDTWADPKHQRARASEGCDLDEAGLVPVRIALQEACLGVR